MKHINMIKNIRDVLLQNIASNRKIQYNFHVYIAQYSVHIVLLYAVV